MKGNGRSPFLEYLRLVNSCHVVFSQTSIGSRLLTIQLNTNTIKNNEFYKNDAIAYKHIQIGQPDYVKGFETINSLEVAYSYFKEQEKKYNKMNNFYVNILNKIHKQYNNADLNKKVLSDYEKNYQLMTIKVNVKINLCSHCVYHV